MHGGLSDTPVEIERLQTQILARRTPAERLRLAMELSADVITRSQDAVRRSMPGADDDAVMTRWVLLHHGEEVAKLFAEGRRRAKLAVDRNESDRNASGRNESGRNESRQNESRRNGA